MKKWIVGYVVGVIALAVAVGFLGQVKAFDASDNGLLEVAVLPFDQSSDRRYTTPVYRFTDGHAVCYVVPFGPGPVHPAISCIPRK